MKKKISRHIKREQERRNKKSWNEWKKFVAEAIEKEYIIQSLHIKEDEENV